MRRSDHSSRGVLRIVVRRCVWSINVKNEGAVAHIWHLSCPAHPNFSKLPHKRDELKKGLQNIKYVFFGIFFQLFMEIFLSKKNWALCDKKIYSGRHVQ